MTISPSNSSTETIIHPSITGPAAVTISGFYGWGSFLVWNFALLSAAFSGLRSSSSATRRNQRRTVTGDSYVHRALAWINRIFSYIRRGADLIAALAIPCIAAGDIQRRRERVSFHQLVNYDHDPSFVPAIYGKDAATDILTIRAAIVVVSHFLTWATALVLFPLVARLLWIPYQEPKGHAFRGGTARHTLRTTMILLASVWCRSAVKPVYCADPFVVEDEWYGGCKSTNWVPWSISNLAPALGVVSCDTDETEHGWIVLTVITYFLGLFIPIFLEISKRLAIST
ncbi:hypothetical protein V8F33_012032 [Rhypophila sp. PSN 637]